MHNSMFVWLAKQKISDELAKPSVGAGFIKID